MTGVCFDKREKERNRFPKHCSILLSPRKEEQIGTATSKPYG